MIPSLKQNHRGFTLVELLVGMTIFSIGMTAILALLYSTINSSLLSRHEIIASNILREQVELVKNMRNTNIRSFVPWNTVRTELTASTTLSGGVYIIENEFSTTGSTYDGAGNILTSPIYMKDITVPFSSLSTLESKFNATTLKLDNKGRYSHRGTEITNFASYIIITPLKVDWNGLTYEPKKDGKHQGLILDARVITKGRFGYREYDLKTVITDWKK